MKSENSVCTVFRADDFRDADGDHRIVAEYAAKRANRLLSERGTRVYATPHPESLARDESAQWTRERCPHDTHTALLIAVEPIRKESAEDVLREIVRLAKACDGITANAPVLERARKVLEGR